MVIDFSDRLRELRLEKGYSQATLSQKITNLGQPLSEAALAKYESGRTIPNLQVAAYLADYFGVSIDYLACGEKASVLSAEGLKEEQIRLLVELIGALQKQNQARYTSTKTQAYAGTAGTGLSVNRTIFEITARSGCVSIRFLQLYHFFCSFAV